MPQAPRLLLTRRLLRPHAVRFDQTGRKWLPCLRGPNQSCLPCRAVLHFAQSNVAARPYLPMCAQVCLETECEWRRLPRPPYLRRWCNLKAVYTRRYRRTANLRKCVEALGEWVAVLRL